MAHPNFLTLLMILAIFVGGVMTGIGLDETMIAKKVKDLINRLAQRMFETPDTDEKGETV